MSVVVMRGVSGAGKSTYIKGLGEGIEICSADHYFCDGQGNYHFDASNLGLAHNACLRKFMALCRNSANHENFIVVDNTNTTVAEMAPYMAVAAAYGHDAKVITINCDPEIAAARNVHGVPVQTVKAQHDRIVRETKNMPPWWSHEIHMGAK